MQSGRSPRVASPRLPARLFSDAGPHTIGVMMPTENPEILRSRIHALQIEHRDLDEVISRLAAVPPQDQLLVRRLKKRKLQLKDRITQLEGMLEPDVPA
jgi:hypothetical protein